jgi:hypothetical protein
VHVGHLIQEVLPQLRMTLGAPIPETRQKVIEKFNQK